MPSRRETFGLVAVEAMASGVPVLVTDTPGPKTFVRNSYGRIVPANDAVKLADTIDWFYNLYKNSPEELRRMGIEARAAAVKDYDWEIVADRISNLVKNAAP
jgi:glycosyltransferase involved in cell wall biosynthesis